MSAENENQVAELEPVAVPVETEQTPVLETTQSQEEQQTDANGDQQERDDKGRFKGVQPRIDELTRKRHEAEREAAYWRGVATQGKAQTSVVEQTAAPTKPSPDQFDDYGAYVEALAEFKAEEKITKVLSERETKAAEKQHVETRAASWNERQASARAAMPDYDAVVGASSTPIAQHVAETILESEHGPALAYHFAKNPDVLERLNSLSPRQADREIGRLEERLSSPTEVAATPVKTSAAPRPATPLASQGRSNTVDPSKMTQAEYEAFRKKQGAQWAR
jgi:hypothetical protein